MEHLVVVWTRAIEDRLGYPPKRETSELGWNNLDSDACLLSAIVR